jgi:hypothetical protein
VSYLSQIVAYAVNKSRCCGKRNEMTARDTATGGNTEAGLTFAYYSRWLYGVPTHLFTIDYDRVPTVVGYFDERALMHWFDRRSPIHRDRMLRTWRGANAERAILTKSVRGGRGTLISCDALVVWLSNLHRCIVGTAKRCTALSDNEWLSKICRVSSTKTNTPWIVYSIVALSVFATILSHSEQTQQLQRLLATPPVMDKSEREEMARHELLAWRDAIAPINAFAWISSTLTTIQQTVRDGDELQLMELRDQINARLSDIQSKRSIAHTAAQSINEIKRRRVTPELLAT